MTALNDTPVRPAHQDKVTDEHHGRRIDNYLFALLKGLPKSRVYRMIRKGEVRVNGGRVKQDYRLVQGDMLRIPPHRCLDVVVPPPPPKPLLTAVANSVIYEDDSLLVLNKPAGIPVHAGSGLNYGVIELLRFQRGDDASLELVHRLDRETSGCLLLAKDKRVLRDLHGLIRTDGIEKIYLALLRGCWQGGGRWVEAPLKKNVLRSGERVVMVRDDGKTAKTWVNASQRFSHASLVEVKLLTGRTHQIRVHMAHIGHPLAGDEKYGDQDFNARMARYGLRRLFLHAHSLRFHRPVSGDEMHLEAPLPNELAVVIKTLK